VRIRLAGLVTVAALLPVAGVSGQVPWESPLLVGPGSPSGLSILLADPGAGIGVLAHWTGRGRNTRTGFRIGIAEEGGPDDDLAVFGGVDISGPLMTHSEEFPLDLAWVGGVGAGVGDNVLISIPFGISFGRVLTDREVWFHPYVTPRFIVDAYLGNGNRDDLELGFALDLGADFAFSGNWAFRFGAAVGDRDGLAVGVVIPTGD
jgi:hypothetical protein